jgi:PAS domain S-box-containing protein
MMQEHLQSSYLDFVLLDKNDKTKATIYSIPNKGEIKELYTNIVGISKHSINSGKMTVEEDIKKSPYYTEWRPNTESEICLPIFHKRTVIGCINLEFKKRQKFDKDTITTLEIISKAVGNTVYTASLLEEMKESENRFRSVLEHMNEGLWLGDEKHNTLYVNPKFEQMTGLKYDECLKRDCFGFYDEESIKRIKRQHALTGPERTQQYKLTMINEKKNKPVPVLCSGTPVPGGTVGIFTDLSQLEEQAAQILQLSKSEKLFAHVTENSIDGIVSSDKNLIINTWNKGAQKMFGYSQEEVLGKNSRILIPEDKLKQGELEQIIKLCLEKGFVRNFETTRVKKGGKEFQVAMSATKLLDEKERFMGFGVIYRDITYQKKAEQELQARFESMQNAYLELGKQRRQLDYLLETLNIAIGDEEFPNIENYLVNAAIMLTKSDGATLRLYNEKDEMLHLKALSGVQASWWGKSKVPFKGSIAERAYQSRRPLFINDLQNNPIYASPKLASDHGFIAAMCLPLYVKNRYLGNINLYTSDKNKLNLVDDSFISNFSKQASLALVTNSKKLAQSTLK